MVRIIVLNIPKAAKVPTVIEPVIAKYDPTPITMIGPKSVTVLIAANE